MAAQKCRRATAARRRKRKTDMLVVVIIVEMLQAHQQPPPTCCKVSLLNVRFSNLLPGYDYYTGPGGLAGREGGALEEKRGCMGEMIPLVHPQLASGRGASRERRWKR